MFYTSSKWWWLILAMLAGWFLRWLVDVFYWRRRRRVHAERLRRELSRCQGKVAELSVRATTEEVQPRRDAEASQAEEAALWPGPTADQVDECDAPISGAAGTAGSLPRPIPAQDLSAIRGVGPALEQKLYNAGIGTYAQLAALGDAEVGAIVQPKDWQEFDCETWNGQALRLAKRTATEGAVWNGIIPDDLSRIRGIGEVFEQRLYEAGVCTFADLASVGVARLQSIIQAEKWQAVDFDDWVSQAQARLEREAK